MNAAAIPAELRERDQWVVWKAERRSGKWTKVPYRAADARTKAKCDDPRTWGTFEQAIAWAAEVQGVGYMFSAEDPFTGVDLDGCIDVQTGELHPAACEVLEQLGGYQERSPSDTGLHAIVRGKLIGDRNRTSETPWGGVFEVYDQRRFFTVTGNGEGAIVERQAQLDKLVARMFGEASQNGAARSTGSRDGGVDTQAILDRHEDLAKIAARKGTKPKGGTASDWDYMLGCRAAEHGYDDDVLRALIRHARQAHGEEKGERDDYVERTVAAVRKRVGQVGVDAERGELLAELTKALRLPAGRRVVSTLVTGHGNSATAAIELDDGYTIEFENFEHVAQPAKLADTLATTVGVATDFTKLQSRRAAALVRLSADRREEFRQHSIHVDEAAKLLRIAAPFEFDLDDQTSRWATWLALENTDPDAAPADEDAWKPQRRDDRHAAEAYGRRVVIPVDVKSGVRFVHASWFQRFMGLRLGPGTTPQKTRQALLRAGWQTRGRDGRIKATRPRELGEERAEVALTFYLVAPGWETRLGAEEIGGGSR